MSMAIVVAPSILSADALQFGAEIAQVEAAGADWHHVDVMDGHFVPNLTYGPPLITALKKIAKKPLDVHIMVTNPDEVAADYVKAGASSLSFHIEAAKHAHRVIQTIQGLGARAGIAINPGTAVEALHGIIDFVDYVNVMSVNPGFGGQSFIATSVEKVERIQRLLKERGRADKVQIEVDGGINEKTGRQVVEAGATVLVAGTYVYGAKDRAQAIKSLRFKS